MTPYIKADETFQWQSLNFVAIVAESTYMLSFECINESMRHWLLSQCILRNYSVQLCVVFAILYSAKVNKNGEMLLKSFEDPADMYARMAPTDAKFEIRHNKYFCHEIVKEYCL